MNSIADNVALVRERIAQAAARVGRSPDSVSLMAVSKTVEPERIRQAAEAGIRIFGENRVQEFAEKFPDPVDRQGAEWHLIGHLQTNKVNKTVELFDAVDSIDSLRLAERLNRAAAAMARQTQVLIEFCVGVEESKSSVPPYSPQLDLLPRDMERLD